MKKKSLATLLSGFLTVALTGVGFASWIITGGDTEETTGNVSAETVENRKTTITIDTAGEGYDTAVLFGHNANKKDGTGTVTATWFKTEGIMKDEDLSAKLCYKITNATYSDFAFSLDAKMQQYVTDGYITVSFENFVAPTTNAETAAFVNINFGWGEKFGTMNPYEYFNGIASPDEDDVNAALAINNLFSDLNGEFTVTLTATLKAA